MRGDRLFLGVLGAERSVAIPVEGALTIGRGSDCDVQLHDPLVSRRHAIVRGGASPTFEELASKNPSVLMRGHVVERIAPERPLVLACGDVLKLGAQLVGVHRGAAVARLVRDEAAFEQRVAAACRRRIPFAVIRVQIASSTGADRARTALYSLIDAAEGVVHGLLGVHELALLVRVPAAGREAQHLAMQLAELGVAGVVGVARFPCDGDSPAALLAATSANVETIRAAENASSSAPRSPAGAPAPLTSFIGRDRELAELRACKARLVTLHGPPGIGKSRLAMRLGPRAYCDLASTDDPEPVIARAGGLVVLDHADEVDLAGLLARWLERSRDARFVVVSRAILDLPGEHGFELGPLDDRDAIQLFCERGGVEPDEHAGALARRLEGVPLALELAARGLDIYTAAELCTAPLDELVDRPMRALHDRAWASLNTDARAVLAACCALDDAFSLSQLAGATTIADLPHVVTRLRRASWIRALDVGGCRRFALYRHIRAYVAGRARPQVLAVGRDARSLALPSGDRVDLSRHASLRRIVLELARCRARGLTSDEMLACGWPGERVDPLSGNARVRVALSRLRGLGLRDVLVRVDDRYVLEPALEVTVDR